MFVYQERATKSVFYLRFVLEEKYMLIAYRQTCVELIRNNLCDTVALKNLEKLLSTA